jgi:glyoxylase I family protein
MHLDHVVLWVESPERALDFYVDIVGLAPVRAREFEEGKAPFPSVRLNETTIIDLMDVKAVSLVREFTGSDHESGGTPINHVCLSMDAAAYTALTTRLRARRVPLAPGGEQSFGAQGLAAGSAYFSDPDGNVIEIRHYDSAR